MSEALSPNNIVINALIGIMIYSFGYHKTSPLLNQLVSRLDLPSVEGDDTQ
tara:strand:- start:504 stop:656 length:153 start_codon:yes stop_codon:yes gene_type:complete